MKAVRLYAPGDLRVEDIPIPQVQPDEALIEVKVVGVCGSDIPRINTYGSHVFPITPGHEFSGVITQVGSELKGFQVGDRVTVPPLIPCGVCEWCKRGAFSLCDDYDYYGSRRDGSMAEYVSVKGSNLLKLPEAVSYEEAATTDPCANGHHAMARSGFKAGETICLCGVGPIGLFSLLFAKAMGAKTIIAVDVWDDKLDLAKRLGADVIINSKNQDMVQAVADATGGIGADVVIDFSGFPPAQRQCVLAASKQGRVIFLGISHQPLELSEKEADMIMRRELDIRGSWNSFGVPFPGPDWTESLKLLAREDVSVAEIISHRLPLDKAPEIFAQIAKGGLYFNKIMFYPDESLL